VSQLLINALPREVGNGTGRVQSMNADEATALQGLWISLSPSRFAGAGIVESVTIPAEIRSESKHATKHSLKSGVAIHPHDGAAVAVRTRALRTETQGEVRKQRKMKHQAYRG
jgi:hypothetical protein